MGLFLSLLVANMVAGTPSSLAVPNKVGCLRALEPLAEDQVPTSAEFAPADCVGTEGTRAYWYDRSRHTTRLVRQLEKGEIVAAFPEYGKDIVVPGQTLALVSSVGVVRVERQVEALEEARPGQRLFVRSTDGDVLSVRYEGRAP